MPRDPLLAAIERARDRKNEAHCEIRILLAYARELTAPRPYRLTDLAYAAGMSISGVRTAYTGHDVTAAAILLALQPSGAARDDRHIAASVRALVRDQAGPSTNSI